MSGIAITFPSSPIEGQSYLAQNGFTYIYDSQKNRWKRGGEFVRAPKILTLAGISVTTTGSGISTGPNGALIYAVSGGSSISPTSDVGIDSYKAYRTTDSYPNYTEIQVSISSAFSSVAYAATSTSTTFSIPPDTLSGNTTYYVRARQFVGSNASAASTGAISGYSQNIVKFTTQSVFLDAPTIVSIAASTRFPVYQIGFAGTTLPATVTYTGGGLGNLDKVEWRITGPRIPSSTGDTALAEVGIGTHSSATLANSLVLAMPFSGASGVGITSDVNNAIRTASGASAGTTKTVTAVGSATTANVGIATTTAHFYSSAAYFNGSNQYLNAGSSSDYLFGTGDFTIESWFYLTRNSSRQDLCGNYSGASTGWGVALGDASSNGMYFYYGNTTYAATSAGLWTTNRWNHIALSRKSGVLSIYLNGSIVSSASASVDVSTTSYSTFIGAVTDTSGNPQLYCMGYLQDFKIYKGLAKYTENFTPPLPTYGTISYTTGDANTTVGVATTSFFESTGDTPTAEVAIGSSTAAQVASSLVLAMPMNRTFGFQDINVAVRGLTSGASAGTAKTVGLGTTSTANAPSHPIISSTESKWYDGSGYFDGSNRYLSVPASSDFDFGTGNFTIEWWQYWSSLSSVSTGYHTLWSNNYVSSPGLLIQSGNADGTYRVFVSSGTQSVTEPTSPPINTWIHYAIVRSGNTFTIYRNGVVSATGTSASSAGNSGAIVEIGRGNSSYYLYGYLQDLKIYKGFAKYTANFTPSQPICGFTTDISTQTGFTTTSATGTLLSSTVGLGTTSSLSFSADQNLIGVTSITSSSGITTLPDPYAQNLVLALPLANITGVGNSFTNDRNTQIRSVSITGAGVTAGTTKTITNNNGISTSTSFTKWYNNTAYFDGSDDYLTANSSDFAMGTGDFTVEGWLYQPGSEAGDPGIWTIGPNALGTDTPGYTNSIGMGAFGGSNNISVWNNNNYSLTGVTSKYNVWYHFANVRRSGVQYLFIDGVLVWSNVDTTNYTGTYLGLGAAYGSNYAGRWYIQDFRIYKGTAKYTTNFTPPPPMFGDYTRSTPNKLIFTPSSDYALEARNTSGIVTSSYSATRQWGTKPKGGIYDPYASSLILALPLNNTTTLYDTTGQIKLETPTSSYSSGQTVTSPSGSTYTNRSMNNNNTVTFTTGQYKYYGYSGTFASASSQTLTSSTSSGSASLGSEFTVELWAYKTSGSNYMRLVSGGNSGSHVWTIGFDTTWGSGLQFNWYDGTDYYSRDVSSIVNHFGNWYHIAVSRTGSTLYYWLNGVNAGTSVVSATYTANEFVIGNRRGVNEYWNGHMNDIRVYNGICKYTSNFTPPNQIYVA